jgi:hypothetical protein
MEVQAVTPVMASVVVVMIILGDSVTRRNFILHCQFVKYGEFELQMGIKLFCINFPSKILVCLIAPGIQYMKK